MRIRIISFRFRIIFFHMFVHLSPWLTGQPQNQCIHFRINNISLLLGKYNCNQVEARPWTMESVVFFAYSEVKREELR